MAEAAIRADEDCNAARERRAAGGRARFGRISLTDFRSYAAADIALDGRPCVFTGPNGAGKTNILEALSLIGPGRGLRAARLDDLARRESAGAWAISARLDAGEGSRQLGVGSGPDRAGKGQRRICRLDQSSVPGPSSFAEIVRFTWLTPSQDRLFVESAGERRRFFDRMASARDPAHARAARDYELAMRQRQKLLDAGSRDDAWLSGLEAEMAAAGVALAAGRRETAGALVAAETSDGAFPAADLTLEGEIEAALERGPAADVEEAFAARLSEGRRADAEAGRARAGPHRSDILVAHRATGLPARLASTGEQKALLIGLVLANARALALASRFRGDAQAPLVILLDEVAAHLDAARRAALFDILDALGFQVFMTGTDQSLFSAWGSRAQGFDVSRGRIREIQLG